MKIASDDPYLGNSLPVYLLGKLISPGFWSHAWGSRCVSFRGSFSGRSDHWGSHLFSAAPQRFHQIFWDFTLWLCQNSYGKSPFIVSFPLKMVDLSIVMLVYQRGKGKNGKSVPNIHSSQETFFIPFSVFWMVCSPANPSKSREQAWLPLGNLKRTQRPSPAVVVGEWLHAQIHIVLCPIHGLCTNVSFPAGNCKRWMLHPFLRRSTSCKIQRKPCPHIISYWLYSISEGSSVIRLLIYACHG